MKSHIQNVILTGLLVFSLNGFGLKTGSPTGKYLVDKEAVEEDANKTRKNSRDEKDSLAKQTYSAESDDCESTKTSSSDGQTGTFLESDCENTKTSSDGQKSFSSEESTKTSQTGEESTKTSQAGEDDVEDDEDDNDTKSNHRIVVRDFYKFFAQKSTGDVDVDIMKYTYLAPDGGAERFAEVTRNEKYYATKHEIQVVQEHGEKIAKMLSNLAVNTENNNKIRLVEWGPGPADMVRQKTLKILEPLTTKISTTKNSADSWCYEAVDVNELYCREAVKVVSDFSSKSGVSSSSVVRHTDFFSHGRQEQEKRRSIVASHKDHLPHLDDEFTCMVMFGLTFGNFDGNSRQELIRSFKDSYDIAIFSVDHNLNREALMQAYNIPEEHAILSAAFEYFQDIASAEVSGVTGFDFRAWDTEFDIEQGTRPDEEVRVVGYIKSLRDHTMQFDSSIIVDEADENNEMSSASMTTEVEIKKGDRFEILRSIKISEKGLKALLEHDQEEQRSKTCNNCSFSHPPEEKIVIANLRSAGSHIGLVVVGSKKAKGVHLHSSTNLFDSNCLDTSKE